MLNNRVAIKIDVILVALFTLTAEASLWFQEPLIPRILLVVCLIAIAVRNHHQSRAVGLGLVQPTESRGATWVRLAVYTGVAGLLMGWIAWCVGAWQGKSFAGMLDKTWPHWLGVKFPTVVGQQIMLQCLLVPLLFRIFGSVRKTCVVAAGVFSLLHLPNPLLMIMTFIAGAVWVSSYLRSQRLGPLVVSHFVLAVLAAGMGGEYIFNMRVGPGCCELFPRQKWVEGQCRQEFPFCLVGCVERIQQIGNELTFSGWMVDSVHQQPPRELIVETSEGCRVIPLGDLRLSQSEEWPQASENGFVGDDCYAFQVTVDLQRLKLEGPVVLWAANANGYLAKINCPEFAEPELGYAGLEPLVLYPREMDGRINRAICRGGELRVNGWGVSLKEIELAQTLEVQIGGQRKSIELAPFRTPRPDIAKSFSEQGLLNSGFDVVVEGITDSDLQNIKFYLIGSDQVRFPLPLTAKAEDRMNEIRSASVPREDR